MAHLFQAPAPISCLEWRYFLLLGCCSGEGNGTPLQYSCLENPVDGGAWWAAVHGVSRSRTRLHFHFHFSLSRIGEGNGNPLQCSCLENPRDGGAWWAAVSGVAQSRTRLKRLSSSTTAKRRRLTKAKDCKVTVSYMKFFFKSRLIIGAGKK